MGQSATSQKETTSEPLTEEKPTMEPEFTTKADCTTDAKPTTEPECTTEPKPTTEPECTTDPKSTTETECTTDPKSTTEPEFKTEPKSTTEPEFTTEESPVPILVAPPLALDNQSTSWKASDESNGRNMLQKGIDLMMELRPRIGSDLTSFPLPPQFNMPKSQLQLYAEQIYCCRQNMLDPCADEEDPIERFLAVVRWHLSLTRPTPLAKAPYNPILGETHHVTAGDLSVFSEQVSHHPPISALYATNAAKKIEVYQTTAPVPRLWGGSVEVTINGTRTLKLGERGETYESTTPVLSYRFLPNLACMWTGDTTVRCFETGLEATVSYKSRSFIGWGGGRATQIKGTISRVSSGSKEVLFNLSGCWDKTVELEDAQTGAKRVLYDAEAAITNLKAAVVKSQDLPATESLVVWRKITEGLWNENWETARKAKKSVEEKQRQLRRERAEQGVTWKPQFFTQKPDGGWEWASKGNPVPQALVVAVTS